MIRVLILLLFIIKIKAQQCKLDDYLDCKCNLNKIDCSFNDITQLNFAELNIKHANFSYNQISTIDFGYDVLNVNILDLSFNKITRIESFNNLPHLQELNLAFNKIEFLNEFAFNNQNTLQVLNLSNSFDNNKFRLANHLCQLYHIRILDLSGLDLRDFSLECHKSGSNHEIFMYVEELYLENVKNIDKSWPKWFKHLGNSLKVLNIKNSDINSIEFYNHTNLETIVLTNNQKLRKNGLEKLLSMTSIKAIELSNLSLTNDMFPLEKFFNLMHKLNYLDISRNEFNMDIGLIIENICKLEYFNGAHNNFKISTKHFINNPTNLEYLDLSYNLINSTLLYSLVNLTKLKAINLSNNLIDVLWSEFMNKNLVYLFANMENLTQIDLSFNSLIYFVAYLKSNSIKTIDVSHNSLKYFRILSDKVVDEIGFPMNIDTDDLTNDYSLVDMNSNEKKYLKIHELNLSNNHFMNINLNHQLGPVKSISILDLSFNPIKRLTGSSVHDYTMKASDTNIEWNQALNEEDLRCIDEFYLDNSMLTSIPSLEFSCIGKISLSDSKLTNIITLKVSKFTLSMLKYINLQLNNITELTIVINEASTKLNKGNTNNNSITYIDIHRNSQFKCDCDYMTAIESYSSHIKFIDECNFNLNSNKKCKNPLKYPIDISKILHKRIMVLLGLILIIILILISLICYSLASDKLAVLSYFDWLKKKFSNVKERLTSSFKISRRHGTNAKIPYVKLDRSQLDDASTVEIEV
jgi:Leucine-rich repeat (LRR) protein